MPTKYLFETQYFRFTETEIQLLRSRYPYRSIGFQEINKIYLIKSLRVKRPVLLLAFGLLVSFCALYAMLATSGLLEAILNSNFHERSFESFKIFGYFLVMGGFLLAIGGIAIFQATFPTWVMRLELRDGTEDVMTLKKLFETNEVFKLSQFLRNNFKKNQLDIDNRIG